MKKTAAGSMPNFNSENWKIHFKGTDSESIRRGFLNNLEYNIAKDRYTLTDTDTYHSLAYTIRERLIERWILTQQEYHKHNVKRVYYLSLEFLMGRLLHNSVMNLGLLSSSKTAMDELGLSYEDILDQEPDAGLGNGGLGRLAACFLDSMATMELPAIGYGIRYEFGIFKQKVIKGHQVEVPEEWLQLGNPWEIERPEYRITIKMYGKTKFVTQDDGTTKKMWIGTQDIIAVPYDIPVPGFGNNTVNTLRLWSARAAHEFDLEEFNQGDYIGACEDKLSSENISKVLYPNDNNHSGKQLRLKQQHFFTSASLQDIIRRFLKENHSLKALPEKVAIQINDTHPAIAIVELMRLLVDEHGLEWDDAWEVTTHTFAYTNHTLMPEALERWSVAMMQDLLPRHMEIIYEINTRFLRQVSYKYPGNTDLLRRMSLIEEGNEPKVRMAYLAIVGSHSVNGVAALHTQLLKTGLVKDFYDMWPQKFNNKTNGITQRRWLYAANQGLSGLITEKIGSGWIKDLEQLKGLEQYCDDAEFHHRWLAIKQANKQAFVQKVYKWDGIVLNPDTMFDVQVKRIHEYKRQLLACLHGIALYNRIKKQGREGFVPRTIVFAGKAAPGYFMAKLIIKFINDVAAAINQDPQTNDLLQMHFLPNYRVSLAEALIPAADLSEQISTAGTEASGTGNMKFALNGAVTIGTMDGANIEIREAVGAENIFIFGLRAEEVSQLWATGYNPWDYFNKNEQLQQVMELITSGFFNHNEPGLYKPIYDTLLGGGDRYMLMADFASYWNLQLEAAKAYADRQRWARMSILNVANMGRFSSDRTIMQYSKDIWGVKPVSVELSR
jgi:starch phosphorylase